ncbi:MAG: apolipoprotein N-acyltransferase [Myxococcota bacterium]
MLYGVLTFLAFPHELPLAAALDTPAFDLGLLATWGAPAALVVGLRGLSPRRALRVAFLASFVAHTVFFYWFLVVVVIYAGMPLAMGLLAPVVPALYVAPFTALFAWGFTRFVHPGLAGIALGAAAWVAVDWARGHFLGGFPWGTLGYGLHLDAPLLGWTRIGGVYVLSFVAAAVGLALAAWWVDRSAARRRDLLVVVGTVVLLHPLGWWIGSDVGVAFETVRVAAIQGNVDQGRKWDAARREEILSRYLALSREVAPNADWIVWPETAVPGLVEQDGPLRGRLADLARDSGASLVVGGMGVEVDWEARRFSAYYDSAFLFDPNGVLEDRYDKTHLVPFGEFVPLRDVLGQFFQAIASGLSSSDVTPGERPRNLALVWPGDPDRRRPVGVPICYELIFPDLVRRMGGEGAGALLAITNDAWYGRTGAPHQFLAMTAMRAAENGLPVVRAANTGVSALIDARGRVVQHSALFEPATVVGEIGIPTNRPPTFYARHGDVFAAGCTVAWILGAGWAFAREKKQQEAH